MRRSKLKKFIIITALFIGIYLIYNTINDGQLQLEKDLESEINDLPVKVNWENQDLIDTEMLRDGPGEQGMGVFLTAKENLKAAELIKENGFNALVSDKISVFRSVKDLRIEKCKWLKYDDFLPPASIIIPFHNEHWSTLLRTIHSLLARAPVKLVKEIILVDDKSTKEFLGQKLDEYISVHFTNVRILRTKKREGLIRARLLGAKEAEGTVLIFIDSHCEAGINWLPPLLQPIRNHYKTITCPFIDVINNNDFSFHPQDEGARGAFDWNFNYKRLPRLAQDITIPEQPFDSPIMAGGLFAISKSWFWELGGYDNQLEIWGGEQYELSFKIWMCGGRMVDVPCSRIGHIYRQYNPFSVSGLGNYVVKNHKRVAEVWMDQWKKYIYQRHPKLYSSVETGDISEQIKLRNELNCTSFDWFMKNIAFDLLKNYPIQEPSNLSSGWIKSEENGDICLDFKYGNHGDFVQLDKCISSTNSTSNNEQNFTFTWEMEIKPTKRNVCMDYPLNGKTLLIYECHGLGGNQMWKFNPTTRQIIHSKSRKCLDSDPERYKIFIENCSKKATQKWILENFNKKIAKYLLNDG